MRKFIYLCSIIVLFALATYAQNTTVTLGTVDAPASGQKVTVPINVTNLNNIGAVTLKINYDPAKVRFDSSSRASEFIAGAAGGVININRSRLNAVTPANGKLLDLYFTYFNGSADLTFNTSLSELADLQLNIVPATFVNGGIIPPVEAITVKLDTVEASGNNTPVVVPLNVTNFDNIGSVTLKINYDQAVAQFDSVSRSDEFIAAAVNGVITISRADIAAVTPTDGKLLDLYFTYSGTGSTGLDFTAAESELTDVQNNVLSTVTYINGRIVNNAQSVIIDIGEVEAETIGQNIVVPVNVQNFTNIGSVTFNIDYNTSALQFDSVSRKDEFIASANNGVIGISRAEITPATPENGTLFNLYFKYLGGNSDLTFGTGNEVTDVENNIISGVDYRNGSVTGEASGSLSLELANVVAGAVNSTVTVPLTVANFNNVGSYTIRIQFDPSVARYDSVSADITANAVNGELTLSRAELTPVEVTDGKLLDIYFTYLGGNTDLMFNQPATEVTDVDNNVLSGIQFADGSIVANEEAQVKVALGNVGAGAVNSVVAVPVTVDNFVNVGSITWAINYNPAVAQYDSVSSDEYIVNANNGILSISRAELTPVQPDSGKIIDLYFTYLGGSTNLTFGSENEITDVSNNVIAGVDYVNGSIQAAGAVRVELDSVQAVVNSTIEVPVNVDNFTNIGSVTLKINYNPAVAQFDSVSTDNDFIANAAGGVLTLSRASLTPVSPDSGKVVSLYFRFLGGNTNLTFDIAANEITDVDNNVIAGVIYVNGNISGNIPAVFESVLPDTTISEGDSLSFTYVATDVDNDSITYALVVPAPAGVAINSVSGVLTWVPTFTQAGTYNLIVRATSAGVTIVDSAVVTVSNTNRAPVFVNVQEPVIAVYYPTPGTVTFQYTAEDADGDSLIFQLINAPAGATISESGLFTFTATDTNQTGSFTVIVSDTSGGADTSVTAFDVLDPVIPGPSLPTEYSLNQNFPNPFNPSTMIRFALPSESHVTLKIFNLLGEEVKTMVNEVLSAGYHEYKFDAASLSTGIYIYRIQANDFISTKKMTLIK